MTIVRCLSRKRRKCVSLCGCPFVNANVHLLRSVGGLSLLTFAKTEAIVIKYSLVILCCRYFLYIRSFFIHSLTRRRNLFTRCRLIGCRNRLITFLFLWCHISMGNVVSISFLVVLVHSLFAQNQKVHRDLLFFHLLPTNFLGSLDDRKGFDFFFVGVLVGVSDLSRHPVAHFSLALAFRP